MESMSDYSQRWATSLKPIECLEETKKAKENLEVRPRAGSAWSDFIKVS